MITNLHRQNRLVFAVVIGLLSGVVSIASLQIYEQQKDVLLADLEETTLTEIELIGGVLSDAMLRNDYSEGRRLLSEWPAKHPNVASMAAHSFPMPPQTKRGLHSKKKSPLNTARVR